MSINLLVDTLSISLRNVEEIVLRKKWVEEDPDLEGFDKLDEVTVR